MTVQDALHQLKLEISENENRKDFSFSEKMKWADELKKEYSKIAEKNMKGGKPLVNVDGGCINKLDTIEQIANDLDMSTGTLSKAQYIYNNVPEDLIQQLDSNQLSINKAYNTLKEQLRAEKDKAIQLEHQLKLEISENENRKDFSFSEKMKWAEQLKEEYSKIAKENMSEGGEGFKNSENLNSAKNIANEVGFGSTDTYYKAKYINENAPEDLIEQLDNEQLSINKAYITLKEQLRAEKEKANYLEQQLKQEQSKPKR